MAQLLGPIYGKIKHGFRVAVGLKCDKTVGGIGSGKENHEKTRNTRKRLLISFVYFVVNHYLKRFLRAGADGLE
jgi:hypothetical protein